MKINDTLDSEGPAKNTSSNTPDQKPMIEDESSENLGLAKPSEKEQEVYDMIVALALKVISNKSINERIIKVIKNGKGEPSEVLAKAALIVTMQVNEKLKGKIPPPLMMQASAEILEHVADFAAKSGVLPVDQQVMNHASVLLMKALMDHLDISPEMKQQMIAGAKGLIDQSPMRGKGQPEQEQQPPQGIIQGEQ